MDIDPAILPVLLRYEPETGKLFWRRRPREYFVSDKGFACWNGKHAGQEAFTSTEGRHLYHNGRILGRSLKAHRVIWALVHGKWPTGQIDHINGNRQDNRLVNLREVSRLENHRNMKRFKNNTSGHAGVIPFKGRWQARITVDYRGIHLGTFDTVEEAVAARAQADIKYKFHKNHGRPAPLSA